MDSASDILITKRMKAFKKNGHTVELIGQGNNCNFVISN